MRFTISNLARPADVDVSDLTTAKRTGPAAWVNDGVLDIPFDRTLTSTEVAAITLRLTSADTAQETARAASAAYLAITTPTTAENTAQIRALTRLVLGMFDQS